MSDEKSPPTDTVDPPVSAGFESTERQTPMGVEPSYDFASDGSEELWIAKGRPTLGAEPSGKGGYTASDVRAALTPEGGLTTCQRP